jgi:GT2 family glycosyltransferase
MFTSSYKSVSQKDLISRIRIVDNNFQVITLDIIKEFSTSLPIKVIKLRHNLGFTKAVKLALLFSRSPYVSFSKHRKNYQTFGEK